MKKIVLDPCCGSKMMWFDKENPHVVYGDIRKESHILCDGRDLVINPDIQIDYTNIPFTDNYFKHVVFDPSHMKTLGKNSWMAKKYGVLGEGWEDQIKKGFDECMRVLDLYGTLIFKWNQSEIKVSEILEVIKVKPLYGHTSGRQSKTIWMCFIKTESV